MNRIRKIARELSIQSFKMLLPYTIIIIALSFVNMIFFEVVVNNLFAFIAYVAKVDVIATGTLSTLFKSVYLYPLYFLLFMVIGIAILVQYLFLINIINGIYISVKGEQPNIVISKSFFKEILKSLGRKIRVGPVLIYFIYFVLLLSLFGINVENMVVNRINISDVITSAIFSNTLYTIFYLIFKLFLLLLIARLTPFIFFYAMKGNSVKDTWRLSSKAFKQHKIKIIIFLLIIFGITGVSDIYSYFIGDDLFYDLYAASEVLHLTEAFLFFISLPILIMDEFVTILFLLYFIHIFFDDDDQIDVENTKFSKIAKKPLYRIVTGLIVLVLIFSEYVSFAVFFENTEDNAQIMVHRGGGNEVFENTTNSILYAIEKGYPAIEIDTMELKDGEIILIHDKTLSRVANQNIKVKDLTLEQIKAIPMIGGYEFITLDEALDLVIDEDLIVNIELKYHGYESGNYINNIVDKVSQRSMEDRIYISSFNYDDLLEIEDINTQIRTMYFSFFFLGNLSKLQVDSVGVDITYLSSDQFYTLKRYGYEVAIFTVNKKKDMLSSLAYELEYIISDEPESLEKLIEGITGILNPS